MKIQIKSTNIELNEAIRNYIEEKILSCEKFLNTKFDALARVEIEKGIHHRKGDVFRAEINLRLPRNLVRVETKGKDLYLIITDLKYKLQTVLKKYKEKKAAEFKEGMRKSRGRNKSLRE